jgi:hypothetical protein
MGRKKSAVKMLWHGTESPEVKLLAIVEYPQRVKK